MWEGEHHKQGYSSCRDGGLGLPKHDVPFDSCLCAGGSAKPECQTGALAPGLAPQHFVCWKHCYARSAELLGCRGASKLQGWPRPARLCHAVLCCDKLSSAQLLPLVPTSSSTPSMMSGCASSLGSQWLLPRCRLTLPLLNTTSL